MFYKDFDIIVFMVKLVTKNTRRKDLTFNEIGGKGLGLVKLSRLEKELNVRVVSDGMIGFLYKV